MCNNEILLAHNGILNGLDSTKDKSDTNYLKDAIETGLLKVEEEAFKKITANNKLIFMSADKYYIINEQLGHWNNNIWYSNYSYKSFYGF